MKQPDSSETFFGLNLRQLQIDWALALSQMASWPSIRWLAPAYPTRVKIANDESTDYLEKTGRALTKQDREKPSRFSGFLLPDNIVLWQPMLLPKLPANEARAAMALEVRGRSPFLPDDVVWGHSPLIPTKQGMTTNLVIASRKIITQHLTSLGPESSNPERFEIWVKPPQDQRFLVLDGFGEGRRRQLTARWRAINLFLVFLLAAIGLAAAVTPTAQLRLRAIQASQDDEKLSILTVPALNQRERLVRSEQQLKALQGQIELALQPELILLRITKLLPDDTYITGLQVQGSKISLTGQTPNTAALMQQLGAQPGVKDVRAPTAAAKLRDSERETFNIGFTLEPSSLALQP